MKHHWTTNCSRSGARGQETQQLKSTLWPGFVPWCWVFVSVSEAELQLPECYLSSPASPPVRLRMHKGVVQSSVCSFSVDFGNYLYWLFILFFSHFLCYGKQKSLVGICEGKRISPEEAPAFCCGSFFALMSKQTSEDCWTTCPPHCPCSPQTSHHLAYSETSASPTALIVIQMIIFQSSSNYLSPFSHVTISVQQELPGNNHRATKSVLMTLYCLQMVWDWLCFPKWEFNPW